MDGDLVMYGGHLCRFVVDGRSAYFETDDHLNKYIPGIDTEPIPLTPEILEKNGFSYIAGHYCNGISDSYVKDGFVLAIIHKSFYIYCAMRHV